MTIHPRPPSANQFHGAKFWNACTGKITTKKLAALAETDHNRVLREDGGLIGKVRAGVRGITILFRYEYWLEGSKRDHRLGS